MYKIVMCVFYTAQDTFTYTTCMKIAQSVEWLLLYAKLAKWSRKKRRKMVLRSLF